MSTDYDILYDHIVHFKLFTKYDKYSYKIDKELKEFVAKNCIKGRYGSFSIPARDPQQSKIASNPEYQDFLKKVGLSHLQCDWIVERWSTGGYSGGNCWNDTAPSYHSSSEKPPSEDIMTEVLTKVAPQITFLQYRSLQKLIKEETYTENEYYGNTTDYKAIGFCLHDLFLALKEMGYV